MSYNGRKRIDLTLKLGEKTFGGTGGDAFSVTGLRINASITKLGGPSSGFAQISVFGLRDTVAAEVTTLGLQYNQIGQNFIYLTGGDDDGMSLVYAGRIMDSFSQFEGMPDVPVVFICQDAAAIQIKPVKSISYRGRTDVVTILSSLAATMGYSFENSGVAGKFITNPHLSGSAKEQAESVARQVGIEILFDETQATPGDNGQAATGGALCIWPRGQARDGAVPKISKATGMVRSPSYSGRNMIRLTTLYNPNVRIGAPIEVESRVKAACGRWIVKSIVHTLESETDNGRWFSELECNGIES